MAQARPAPPGCAGATVIYRASDLAVVRRLDPSYGVLAFNADDSLALVSTTPWASGVATQLALVDLGTGKVIWRYAGGEELSGFLVQPGGRDFTVLLQSPSDSKPPPSVDIVIVHGDGSATAVAGRFNRP